MSLEVICQGCGHVVPVPEEYRRNKIQCQACGVISPVPAGTAKKAPRARAAPPSGPSLDDLAFEELARGDGPDASSPPRHQEPAREPAAEEEDGRPPAKKPAEHEWWFACRRCGGKVRRQGECPSCDGVPAQAAPVGPVVPRLELDEPAAEEDDGKPYIVAGGEEPCCPGCHKPMARGAVVCVACGFHQSKGKKVAKVYEPLVRRWETDFTLRQRLTAFGLLHGLSLVTGVTGALLSGSDVAVFLCSWVVFGVMVAFLMGTYSRLDLTRNARGRVTLTKTWRACFIPLEPAPIDVRGHEGLVSGQNREVGCWQWFILLTLLPAIIPALVWWYVTIHKVTFHVSLAQDHGYPAVNLYQGWSEAQMRDIATTLRDAARLRYEG